MRAHALFICVLCSNWCMGIMMPIYKVDGVKKDGLQKYNVRLNYTSGCKLPKLLAKILNESGKNEAYFSE